LLILAFAFNQAVFYHPVQAAAVTAASNLESQSPITSATAQPTRPVRPTPTPASTPVPNELTKVLSIINTESAELAIQGWQQFELSFTVDFDDTVLMKVGDRRIQISSFTYNELIKILNTKKEGADTYYYLDQGEIE
jgi:hypothetical protein